MSLSYEICRLSLIIAIGLTSLGYVFFQVQDIRRFAYSDQETDARLVWQRNSHDLLQIFEFILTSLLWARASWRHDSSTLLAFAGIASVRTIWLAMGSAGYFGYIYAILLPLTGYQVFLISQWAPEH